jgi:hypothetical protein
MERPIWSPDDEKIMPLGRPVPRSHQSDRSKAVRPVETVRDGSCILTRDMFGFRLLRVQTFSPYLYEGPWPIEGIPNQLNTLPFTFYPQTLSFPIPCCSFFVFTAFEGVMSGLPISRQP